MHWLDCCDVKWRLDCHFTGPNLTKMWAVPAKLWVVKVLPWNCPGASHRSPPKHGHCGSFSMPLMMSHHHTCANVWWRRQVQCRGASGCLQKGRKCDFMTFSHQIWIRDVTDDIMTSLMRSFHAQWLECDVASMSLQERGETVDVGCVRLVFLKCVQKRQKCVRTKRHECC